MEVDFDKEIDAILRNARRDGPVLVGEATRHLDADQVVAFAENAVPAMTRSVYTAHFADCDRCRKILSDLLVMNTGAVPAAASSSVITIAEREIPWYRRLLLFPNLAYVMGGLVLVFGGFLAFTVVQDRDAESSIVSQVVETESSSGGPNFQDEPAPVVTESLAANTTANANTAVSRSAVGGAANAANMSVDVVEEDRAGQSQLALDGIVTQPVPTAPPASTADTSKAAREVKELEARQQKGVALGAPLKDEAFRNDATLKQQNQSNMPAQAGPNSRNERQYNRQLENLDRKRAAAKTKRDNEDDGDFAAGRRTTGGKTFERNQGVWYDTAYQGRPTINVRRGSDEFKRLDAGLRSIANSFSGTVVVVWAAKAYRIE